MYALLEAPLDMLPFVRGDDSGDQVEREDPFGAGRVSVNVERDAHLQQHPLGGMLVAQQMAVGQGLDRLEKKLGAGPGPPVAFKHLIVKAFRIVGSKPHVETSSPVPEAVHDLVSAGTRLKPRRR